MPDTLADIGSLSDRDILMRLYQSHVDFRQNYTKDCAAYANALKELQDGQADHEDRISSLEKAEAKEDGRDQASDAFWSRWGWLVQSFVLFLAGAFTVLVLTHASGILGAL